MRKDNEFDGLRFLMVSLLCFLVIQVGLLVLRMLNVILWPILWLFMPLILCVMFCAALIVGIVLYDDWRSAHEHRL